MADRNALLLLSIGTFSIDDEMGRRRQPEVKFFPREPSGHA